MELLNVNTHADESQLVFKSDTVTLLSNVNEMQLRLETTENVTFVLKRLTFYGVISVSFLTWALNSSMGMQKMHGMVALDTSSILLHVKVFVVWSCR